MKYESHNPTTTLIYKARYFNAIRRFYAKCFNSFYCSNPLNFKLLLRPCISMGYI